MNLKIVLPFRVFTEKLETTSITAETSEGSFEILPRRLDCVATLVPGLLAYTTAAEGAVYVAVDVGVLVKRGDEVVICARRAVGGVALSALHAAVRRDFLAVDTQEQAVRAAVGKMQAALLRQFAAAQDGR